MTIAAPWRRRKEAQVAAEPEAGLPVAQLSGLYVTVPTAEGTMHVLNGVELTVSAGEAVGLVGESGSGKSMTAFALLGLLPTGAVVSAGDVRIHGTPIAQSEQSRFRRLRGSHLGIIFQDPTSSLNPVHRIGRQVSEPIALHTQMGRQERSQKAVELLTAVGIPDAAKRARDYPHQFSGGMRQRVAGAAAISCDPELLIADEPTTALDVTVQAEYLELLEHIHVERESALLFISHDLAVVRRLCDRIAVMYAGRIVETGTTEELFRSPRHPYTQGLLRCLPEEIASSERLTPIPGQPPDPRREWHGCPFAARCPAHAEACDQGVPALTPVGDGQQQVACVRASSLGPENVWVQAEGLTARIGSLAMATAAAEPEADEEAVATLAFEHVVKDFRTRRAVRDVSFAVRKGRSLGIVGETGSGKTTCARLALHLMSPTAGKILFRGRDVSGLSSGQRRVYRQSIQAVFQDPFSSFNPRLRIFDTVAEPLRELTTLGRDAIANRVSECLDMVGLDPVRLTAAYPHQLSGGQRQRVAIARAMTPGPDCIVLDEPLSALDVSIRAQVMNLLLSMQAETGVGYLFIAHDLAAVRYLCDHVVVMYRGQVMEQGPVEVVYRDKAHPYTQRLLQDALLKPAARRGQHGSTVGAGATLTRSSAGGYTEPADDQGCPFRGRCPLVESRCHTERPLLRALPSGETVACHLVN
jgi:peptide/nickel transport system ATP-binding protein